MFYNEKKKIHATSWQVRVISLGFDFQGNSSVNKIAIFIGLVNFQHPIFR